MRTNKNKILAISSPGGHWIELQRLTPLFNKFETIYVSTSEGYRALVPNSKYYKVNDANRWNKAKLIAVFFQIFRIIRKEKPGYILSTGAAPGIIAIAIGRLLFGAKTIWIDSIANTETLSMSGKLSKTFAHHTYTQWEHLSSGKVKYAGTVIA